ncbi:hypothetical protein ABVT39_009658 [Epinephelus coioides]
MILIGQDHGYALPASPTSLKTRLNEALARVESLEREKMNAMAREKTAKTTVKSLLGYLREKNLINEELKERLEFYAELALTLHLHGPKAYKFLRETRHFPLPHPHTLQRWLCSVDDKPGLNKMMLDVLERRCQEGQAEYGCVALMLDAMAIRKHVYSPIATTTGQINWKYINHLNDVPKKDGLHANKITDKHVYFENHKIRVSLAAQTLSHSVSVALRTMRDLGYSQVKDCEATAEFIEMINRLFDTMNGHNPRAKGFKAPLGALNWMERKAFLSRASEYLLTLVTKDGTPLHRSKRYLSVIRFVINIDTLMLMIPELLQVQWYVLTYRFSQDHLELLFNSIRASGGWNNNRSARQFQAIFRRLMVRCGVSPSETGNVAAQDDTVSLSAVEMSSAETAEEHPSPFANISAVVCDHTAIFPLGLVVWWKMLWST